MHFFRILWLRASKSFFFFGILYFALGFNLDSNLENSKISTGWQELTSLTSINLFSDNYFEEWKELENEILYFQKLGFISLTNRQSQIVCLTANKFHFTTFIIQDHLLNLPPPFLS